jgi:hypothetical protein
MLILAGSITAVLPSCYLNSNALPAGDNPYREVLTGRRLIVPRPPDIEDETDMRVRQIITNENFSSDISVGEIYSEIEMRILAEKSVVPPGRTREWIVDLPHYSGIPCPGGDTNVPTAELRFRFIPPARDEKPIRFSLNVIADGREVFKSDMTTQTEGALTVSMPGRMLITRRPVTVRFTNAEQASSRTVVFDTDRSMELLVRESSFGTNLARGLFIIFCRLALISALGLAAGSMLSFPAASFTAVAVILIGFISNFFTGDNSHDHVTVDHHGHVMEQSNLDKVATVVSRKLRVIYAPAMKFRPVELLSEGLLVTWRTTGEAALIMFIIYPALLGLSAGAILRKRQLALPE